MSILNEFFFQTRQRSNDVWYDKNVSTHIHTWLKEKNLQKNNYLYCSIGPMFWMEENLQLQKRVWNMQGMFLESSNLRTLRIITVCISSVVHSFLLASLKSFDKLVTNFFILGCAHHFTASKLTKESFQTYLQKLKCSAYYIRRQPIFSDVHKFQN